VHEAVPARPFTVIGPRGGVLGRQDGSFEAWIFPWKIFSNLRITAEMQNYPVPIDVNALAAVIEVRPDHTTITFSHAAFTIREVLFAPHNAPDGAGVLTFFQIQSVRPVTLTFQFTPEMKRMWPAPSDAYPSPEWVASPGGGFYVLHLAFPDHAAAIAMPGAHAGILPPYQEQPKFYPSQLVLNFDPARDGNKLFPLLLVTGDTVADSRTPALAKKLETLQASTQTLYQQNAEYYRTFLSQHVSVNTPDKAFNDAFAWAEVAIDQLKIQTSPAHDETALAAGFYPSGDSVRPGFGWFFGRDSLWTLYAVNSYGDFQLTRDEIEFLLRRQSPEGKIMHEWSQTANLVNWSSLPYEYASADATPLLLMATNDYLKISGDTGFVQSHWDALAKAWSFETSHDSDGDGIYDNAFGTAWVESWVPAMPHQEIYLAALDQQASTAFAELSRATGHVELAQAASQRAARIANLIEKEYYEVSNNFYAFSWNANGSRNSSPTIYPSVAWWDGNFHLADADAMLSRWASAEFSTDWGTRDLSPQVSFYDPISYHQGSVWPLFTGWVSLSEYRNGRSLSGYSHLMQNADLTWTEDLGAVTELLSGEFFRWLGRSSSHQLWSSAMVITPALRGLFGLDWNSAEHKLTVTPALPAQWDDAQIKGVPVVNSRVDIRMQRIGANLSVHIETKSGPTIMIGSKAVGARLVKGELLIPLPAVEVGLSHALPQAGAYTSQVKVLDERYSDHSLQLRLSAPAGTHQTLFLRKNLAKPNLRIDGATASADQLLVQFPQGNNYVEQVIKLTW
jgi:glycogen debranching enzyme